MSRKCHVILTIVLVLPILHGDAWGEDLASRPGSSQTAAGMTIYPHTFPAPIPGVVRPSRQVTMASPVEGMLMTLQVREGQRVQAGEVLAVMDNRVVQAGVNLAQAAADRSADLQHAREEFKLAESLVQRLLVLKSANGGSDFELLEAQTRAEQARASVAAQEEKRRQSKCQLELELARLESHNLRAPFDGMVVRILAYPGTTLTRDDELLTIIRLEELEVELHLPLSCHDQLQVGRSYPLIAGPPINARLNGQLSFVAPTVDSATQTFRSVFTLRNHDQKLPAGFSVQLDLQDFQYPDRSHAAEATAWK